MLRVVLAHPRSTPSFRLFCGGQVTLHEHRPNRIPPILGRSLIFDVQVDNLHAGNSKPWNGLPSASCVADMADEEGITFVDVELVWVAHACMTTSLITYDSENGTQSYSLGW